jgi:hypothetical protein
MQRLVIACLLAMIVWMAGCGSGSPFQAPNSPFAGDYTGTWSDSTTNDTGTAKMTVALNGNVTGTIVNSTTAKNGSFSGDISSQGVASLTATYPSTAATTLKGTFAFTASGSQLIGTLQQLNSANALTGTPTFTFTKD